MSGTIEDNVDAELIVYRVLQRAIADAACGKFASTELLYAGAGFAYGDPARDVCEWAKSCHVVGALPDNFTDSLLGLIDSPERPYVRNLLNSLRFHRDRGCEDQIDQVLDAIERCEFYLSAMGEHIAHCAAAGNALRRSSASRAVLRTRYLAMAQLLIARAHDMRSSPSDHTDLGKGLQNDIEAAVSNLRSSLKNLFFYDEVVRRAKEAAHDQQVDADLRNVRAHIVSLIKGRPNPEPVYPPEDNDAFADLKDLNEAIERIPRHVPDPDMTVDHGDRVVELAAARIRVVGSLDHLPKTTGDRSQNPRVEFEPIADRELLANSQLELHAAAQSLESQFPWARDVIHAILRDLVGAQYTRLRPTLLVGKPGCGKTKLAMAIGQALALQPTLYPAAGASDSTFGGTSRQWSSGRACVPLQTIKRTMIPNPLIVIDELEKSGSSRYNGALHDVLVSMLERESSSRYFDPYLECPVDLSGVSYVATANDLAPIPHALRDRFRILEVPTPRRQDLPVVVGAIVDEIRVERCLNELWLPDFDSEELEMVARYWSGGSLRPVRRIVETILAGREQLMPRH